MAALPDHVGLGGALSLADATGRLTLVDVRWDPSERYTIWSSLIGGLFLFLSYFGTDQSQAQRLLAGRSPRDVRLALALNGIFKVPFQLLVLVTGALLFVHYLYADQPISFDPAAVDERAALPPAERAAYDDIVERYDGHRTAAREHADTWLQSPSNLAARDAFRARSAAAFQARDDATTARGGKGDTNYVFLDFILQMLPLGMAGLLLAAIFAAALSSIDSELNAMTTVGMVDIAQRLGMTSETTMVRDARITTVLVGTFATVFAANAGNVGALIDEVNKVGSYCYGSLLGVFVLGWLVPRATGTGAFVGTLVGMVAVAVASFTDLAFLYLNTLGTVTVVVVGTLVSLAGRNR